MSSSFTGFSEADLKRIKTVESDGKADSKQPMPANVKKIEKLGIQKKRFSPPQYKLPIGIQDLDENLDFNFDKCKLSIKTPTSPVNNTEMNSDEKVDIEHEKLNEIDLNNEKNLCKEVNSEKDLKNSLVNEEGSRKSCVTPKPDVVSNADLDDDLGAHKVKLEELQLQQKLMEEQNKKRKEMLAKALADRTKQTAEEVQRLEKIKQELQVLDGQFSQDVSLLRKKIDQACLSYAEAEKHYLKIEKEFLQAKIHLQKEKEKKELLTEHLCALITHNETRKAHKLESLMLELASDRRASDIPQSDRRSSDVQSDQVKGESDHDDDKPVILDGVDLRTGKMVEFNAQI